jgi:glycosyl transferase, family 25
MNGREVRLAAVRSLTQAPFTMTIGGYIITLNAGSDRMQRLRSSLQRTALIFVDVEGVNGRGLSPEFIHEHNASHAYFRPIIDTEFGCYLSHVRCCERIVADGVDVGIVLEDDVEITEGFDLVVHNALRSVDRFDLLKLYGRKKGSVVVVQGEHCRLIDHHPVPVMTPAQIWTREGALTFLDWHAKNGMRRPIDVDLRHPWEHGLRILTVDPSPITLQPQTSTIGDRKALPRSTMRKLVYEARFVKQRFVFTARRYGFVTAVRLEFGATISLVDR